MGLWGVGDGRRKFYSPPMPKRSSKKDSMDSNQIAASVVDEATAEESKKDPIAVELGRRGGKKGGRARAEKLSPERRVEIALKAARARWKGKKDQESEDITSDPADS